MRIRKWLTWGALVATLILGPAGPASGGSFSPPAEARAWLGTWKTTQGEFVFDTLANCNSSPHSVAPVCELDGQWRAPGEGLKRIWGFVFLGATYKGEVWQGCYEAPGVSGSADCPIPPAMSIDRVGDKFTDGYWKSCPIAEPCTDHHPITGSRVRGARCVPAADRGRAGLPAAADPVARAACAARPKLVIFGLGDSLSSGEGSPDVFATKRTASRWENYQCDRSHYAWDAQVAARLKKDQPGEEISFHHLACSGASITRGMLGAYGGVNIGSPVGPQVDVARHLAGDRKADAVLLSIGINDLEFGRVAKFCASNSAKSYCPDEVFQDGKTLSTWVEEKLNALPGLYEKLAQRLSRFVDSSRVFILQYPDVLSERPGTRCSTIFFRPAVFGALSSGPYEIKPLEVTWLYDHFYEPLNEAVRAAAASFGWQLLSSPSAFDMHGYCTADRWVVQFEQSERWQENTNGTLHPNREGQKQITDAVYPIIAAALKP